MDTAARRGCLHNRVERNQSEARCFLSGRTVLAFLQPATAATGLVALIACAVLAIIWWRRDDKSDSVALVSGSIAIVIWYYTAFASLSLLM